MKDSEIWWESQAGESLSYAESLRTGTQRIFITPSLDQAKTYYFFFAKISPELVQKNKADWVFVCNSGCDFRQGDIIVSKPWEFSASNKVDFRMPSGNVGFVVSQF